ncbi:MAG: Fe-S cluster assembly protein SufD [Anaerolineae bacterium]|nr:Fe-S cluster assembly protein SufD [Anaerolineae bacterium]MDW8071370.1 Fe-S cluster assembly protein SufD [Anaerolineae bacterium]
MSDQHSGTRNVALSAGIFSRAIVAQLSEALAEPDWMREKRQIAWSLFEEMPMPTAQDERWRRTNLHAVKWDMLRLPEGTYGERGASPEHLPEVLRGLLRSGESVAGRLVLLNGGVVWHELRPEMAAQGVSFMDLTLAVRQHPDLVRRYVMQNVTPGEGKFAALNGALWSGGAFLYIPRGVKIETPFEIVIGLQGDHIALFPRVLIIVEADASATVLEDLVSLDRAGHAFSTGVSEIIVGEGASITYGELQRWEEHVFTCNFRRAVQSAQSHMVWHLGYLGSHLSKTFVDSTLTEDGASCQVHGVYFVRGRQHMDLDLAVHHMARHTRADLLIKGAAQERGRAVFRGLIRIDRNGQQTNSYLKNDNLILSEHARIDSIPSLIIDANDVRASHGATVGHLDEEHIFYLQSRGIPRALAVRLVTEGFFASVLERIEHEHIRRRLTEAVMARLEG